MIAEKVPAHNGNRCTKRGNLWYREF